MTADRPLSGLRIIDLSRVLGAPFCTQILADHGADVIKVEPPAGDETRQWGPPFESDATGQHISSAYFSGTNRGKRDIALDLTKPEARAVLWRLLETADVLVENFRTGTMARWGMDYAADLKPRFPRLIYARFSGFGEDGPLGGAPGYDAVAQAMSGLISVNGSPQSGPMRLGVPAVDITAGMNLALGILIALQARARTGEGALVESTLFDTGLSLLHPHSANWLGGGAPPKLSGNAHPNIVPYDLFETASGKIFLGIGNNKQFAKLLEILGAPELAKDKRFVNNGERGKHREELRAVLEALLMKHDALALSKVLLDAGVPAGAVSSVPEALTSAHTKHRGMVVETDGYRGVASPIRVGAGHGTQPVRPPPRFGADANEILSEAGYTKDEIARLEGCGALVRERQP